MATDILNTNILFKGDSAKLLANKTKFPDKSVNLIITSPPYADKRKSTYGGIHPHKYVEWFKPISKELYRILKDNGSFILNIKEHPKNGERETYVLELILEMKKQGWLWIEEYCWYKKNSFPGKWPNRFRDSWERCLHFTKKKKFRMYQEAVKVPIGDWATKRFKSMSENDFLRYTSKNNSHLGRNIANWLNKKKVLPHNVIVFEEEHRLYLSNVIETATVPKVSNFHSAIFPIELPTWFIQLFTKEGDVVLDPFMGSGSTGVAALLNNRNYLGAEIQSEYVREAKKNILEIEREVLKRSQKGKIKKELQNR
ncbi:MAG: site-specific DNA-methyltransferase [Bacteroidetes bacterium]|nr:site-specific DNA-methyltransferase [Bacteroidota bacterium]